MITSKQGVVILEWVGSSYFIGLWNVFSVGFSTLPCFISFLPLHEIVGLHSRTRSTFSIVLIRWFLTATSGTKPIIVSAGHVYILLHQREKRGSTIQYGYSKWGTHARVFFQTLVHGNSRNEIRQRDRRRL